MVSVQTSEDGEADLGYWLDRSAWGQGFMSEAARATVSHAFRKFGFETISSARLRRQPGIDGNFAETGI